MNPRPSVASKKAQALCQGVEIQCGYNAGSGTIWIKNTSTSPLENIMVYPNFPFLQFLPIEPISLEILESQTIKIIFKKKGNQFRQQNSSWGLAAQEHSGDFIFIYGACGDICIQRCPVTLPEPCNMNHSNNNPPLMSEQAAFYCLSAMITEFKCKCLGFEPQVLKTELNTIKYYLESEFFNKIRVYFLNELNSLEILLDTLIKSDNHEDDQCRERIIDLIETHLDGYVKKMMKI